MRIRIPASLKFTVPLILLCFAAILSAVNLLYHVPEAEREATEDNRKRLTQEMSRLQSTLEYLVLKGDFPVAQREIAVLAHNHDVVLAALTDEANNVIAATKLAWLGRPIADVLPELDLAQAASAIRGRRAGVTIGANGDLLLGYAGVLLGSEREELRPSKMGGLFLAYDLKRYKAEARTTVIQQSIYWAGWVAALAMAMWLVFHFLLTRRTARLVHAAEELAAGNLSARSGLKGTDELGRLSSAFDRMALVVAETQTRLRDDIAERIRVQRELVNSEARLQQILNNATAVVSVKDTEGRFLFVNRQWEHVFRPEPGAVLGKTDRECLPNAIAKQFRTNDMLVLLHDEPMEFEETAPLDDGLHTYISIKFPLHDANGVVYAVCAISTDITERKRQDEALRVSEEQYHAMFNASIDGLALWNAAGEIVDTNPALWRMYGYSDHEFSALPAASWQGPSYAPEFLSCVAAGESLHSEVTELRKDGSALELEVHGIPMQYQGRPHVLTIARDITEKKRAAEELARQRESLYQREKLAALGSLLAGVAHELNNPLSVVVARAVLLEEQGSSTTQAAAQRIRTAAERCARIVRTFLAMARQQQPERGPVALNEVVSAALDIASYAIRTSSVEVTVDLADDMPLIQADADQLHQVLLNLIINAQQSLQEQPPPRKLHVRSRFDRSADVVRITVGDNGPGIPEKVRARVFEPYFTTKPMGFGTGVGLAVSLGIVEAHGGTLTIACPAEGGAVFTIELPVGCVAALSNHDSRPSQQSSARQRSILVVDDEADVRDTLAEILTTSKHHVVTVGSAREALERMAAEPFDVVLTDIRMPDLDGRGLYRQIEERWPTRAQRVVFITGDTLASALPDFVAQSGRPVIEKPFLPSDVRRVVAELAGDGDIAHPD